jgi:hypothetical protein
MTNSTSHRDHLDLLLKIDDMNKDQNLTRAHCIKECKKWLTILNELRIENVRLKEQLSEAVNQNVSLTFVEQAEQFQQHFLEKDQVIDLLRHDIKTMLDKLSEHTITGIEGHKYTVMEKDILKLTHEFHQAVISFYQFSGMNSIK